MPKIDLDWNKVKVDWIAENLKAGRKAPFTYKDAALRWSVGEGTVRNRASDENWRNELVQRLNERSNKSLDIIQDEEAINEVEIRRRQLQYFRMVMSKAAVKLSGADADDFSNREAIDIIIKMSPLELKAAGLPDKYVVAHHQDDDIFTPEKGRLILRQVIEMMKGEDGKYIAKTKPESGSTE